MKNENDVLRDVAKKFSDAGIAYMLTGSMAMIYYAQPRMTRDIDIVAALHPGQVESILRIFGSDYYVAREAVISSIEHGSLFNFIHNETFIKVDCIIQKGSEYRKTEFGRRKKVQFGDFEIYIVSKEDLMISKLDWARDSRSELQLRDVKNLIESGFDHEYMDHWTQKLGLDNLWKECLHE